MNTSTIIKSDTRLGGKSLAVYDTNYHPAYKIRYSLNNLKMDDNLINIPLYLADWTITHTYSKDFLSCLGLSRTER